MNEPPRHILVAGAGLAGLTAAIAFARRGFRVTILERSGNLQDAGAGLQLPSNATAILEKLGVLGMLRYATDQVSAVQLRSARTGQSLLTLPIGAYSREKWGAPYLTAHRGDLHRAMVSAIGYEPGIRVLLSAAVTGYVRNGSGITVTIDRDGYEQEIYGDFLIGADGVRSTVRAQVPGAAAPVPTGYVALRTTLAADSVYGQELTEFVDGDSRVVSLIGRNRHIVIYKVRKGRVFNIVAIIRNEKLGADPAAWGAPATSRIIRKAFRWTHPSVRCLSDEDIGWTTWPIFEVPEKSVWTDGANVVLIGDAAHAMRPFAAQGAAMAVEDADALAECVMASPHDLAAALKKYEAARRARIRRVRKRTRFNGFVYHSGWPVSSARDFFFRRREPLGFLKSLTWLYGFRWPPAG